MEMIAIHAQEIGILGRIVIHVSATGILLEIAIIVCHNGLEQIVMCFTAHFTNVG